MLDAVEAVVAEQQAPLNTDSTVRQRAQAENLLRQRSFADVLLQPEVRKKLDTPITPALAEAVSAATERPLESVAPAITELASLSALLSPYDIEVLDEATRRYHHELSPDHEVSQRSLA